MKRSKIYREAARRIESGDILCVGCLASGQYRSCCEVSALTRGSDEDWRSMLEPYRDLYLEAHWWNNDPPDGRDCRILALCFMAAIAEWEEKHESA